MPREFIDGVYGKEALLVWISGHRLHPTVTINDWAARPWRVIFDDFTFHTAADLDDQRSKKMQRTGERLHPVSEGGRTVTVDGRIQAKPGSDWSDIELRRAEYAMDMAFGERNLEGTAKLWLPSDDQDTDPFWSFAARVLDYDPDDKQDNDQHDVWPFQRHFTLALRQSDPRRYWAEQITETGTASVEVVNPGKEVSPAIFCTVDGTTDLDITNEAIGRNLKIGTAELAADAVVAVDFDKRAIWATTIGGTPFVDGEDITHLWRSGASTWWNPREPGIDLGTQVISQTGADDISVVFYPCL
jgi:hypothetical protein